MGGYYHGCGNPTTPGDTTFRSPRDCKMTDDVGGGGDACFAFEGQYDPMNDDQIIYRLYDHRIQRH